MSLSQRSLKVAAKMKLSINLVSRIISKFRTLNEDNHYKKKPFIRDMYIYTYTCKMVLYTFTQDQLLMQCKNV